jgi:ParB family chromosome partitioning protein
MIGAKTGEDTDRWGWNPLRYHTAKTTARPEFSLVALICAGYEKTIQKDSWRSAEKRHFHYLNQLTTWGYIDRTKSDSFGRPADHWSHRYGYTEPRQFP